jgi:hypothetical protein
MDDDDITEAWRERAAIMEYDGWLRQDDAEYKAARAIRAEFGRITEAIKREMNSEKTE